MSFPFGSGDSSFQVPFSSSTPGQIWSAAGPVSVGDTYNNVNSTHPYGRPFSNPNGSNLNCGAVSLGRMEGYGNADEFQEQMLGWYPGESSPELGSTNGVTREELDDFTRELERNYTSQTFFPDANRTAFQVMRDQYQPPDPSTHLRPSLLAYQRPNGGGGHAVNMFHGQGSEPPTILDYQRSNFGEPVGREVMDATSISVFTPGPYETPQGAQDAAQRRLELHRRGEMGFHEWASGPNDPDGPIPSFEAFQHHVALQGQRRQYR